eukprot:2256167-Prymnesium_polylepis.2
MPRVLLRLNFVSTVCVLCIAVRCRRPRSYTCPTASTTCTTSQSPPSPTPVSLSRTPLRAPLIRSRQPATARRRDRRSSKDDIVRSCTLSQELYKSSPTTLQTLRPARRDIQTTALRALRCQPMSRATTPDEPEALKPRARARAPDPEPA